MSRRPFAYLLILVFFYAQADSALAAIKCVSRQQSMRRYGCASGRVHSDPVRSCCCRERGSDQTTCPASSGIRGNQSCPVRTVLSRSLDIFEKGDKKVQSVEVHALISHPVSPAAVLDFPVPQHIEPSSSPPLFIAQSVLRI